VPKIASKAVKAPDDEDVKLSATSSDQEFVKGRAPFLRATDAAVHLLRDGPTPRLTIAAKLRAITSSC